MCLCETEFLKVENRNVTLKSDSDIKPHRQKEEGKNWDMLVKLQQAADKNKSVKEKWKISFTGAFHLCSMILLIHPVREKSNYLITVIASVNRV